MQAFKQMNRTAPELARSAVGHRHDNTPGGCNKKFDEIYDTEVAPRLDSGQHYMDYTGSSIYLNGQVQSMSAELLSSIYGNPHSANPSSQRTTKLVDEMRGDLLRFFGADPRDYELVYVRSATGGLQMLGESFPWTSSSRFAHLVSNHNSVLGIREYAIQDKAEVGAVTEEEVEAWLKDPSSDRWKGTILEDRKNTSAAAAGCPNDGNNEQTFSLFAYPAQDNFAGVLYSLDWVSQVQNMNTCNHRWFVLLDAAAFTPTHRLNLTAVPADFTCVSFYKMFGLPTGVGAWILRKDASQVLKKTYWGGGSVFTATSSLNWQIRHTDYAHWEDGTLPFLNIMALKHGLDAMERLGGIDAVHDHVTCVQDHLASQLATLQHSNGKPLLRLFGRHFSERGHRGQGAVANFLLLKPNGDVFSYRAASLEFAEAGFHIREGCTCNPGACYSAVGVLDEEVQALAAKKDGNFTEWEWIEVERDGELVIKPLGSLRASLGWMSRVSDVDALVEFLNKNYKDRTEDSPRHVDLAMKRHHKYNKNGFPHTEGC